MKDDVMFSNSPDELVARITCEIDHHTARRIRERIDERLITETPDTLVLDFSEVCFMDSSGLGLILGRCERADSIGASVRLVGMSDSLKRLVHLCGLERIKNLYVRG